MREFNLEEAKAGKPVCTRDGKEVKILDYDFYTPNYQDYTKPNHFMVVKIKRQTDDYIIDLYRLNGLANQDGCESEKDLFMAPENHNGWVNIYYSSKGFKYTGSAIYDTFKEAERSAKDDREYITTTKIEWEE